MLGRRKIRWSPWRLWSPCPREGAEEWPWPAVPHARSGLLGRLCLSITLGEVGEGNRVSEGSHALRGAALRNVTSEARAVVRDSGPRADFRGFGASPSPRLCPVGSVASVLQPRKPRIHVCSRPGLEGPGDSAPDMTTWCHSLQTVGGARR